MKFLTTLIIFAGIAVTKDLAVNRYGHLNTSYLPQFLGDNPPLGLGQKSPNESYNVTRESGKAHNTPWGKRTKPYGQTPKTGRTRHYDFTIERATLNADGYIRESLAINGQIPGPLIEADWGDIIEVTVHNKIKHPEEGTAIHWHGFLMKETPWFDGVPGVVQCPIAPGASFTYRFQAERPGTTWYHSHYSAQYGGGLYGPMVIYGPSHVHFDIDVGPVFISDYHHRDYFNLVKDIVGPDRSRWHPASNNSLINGRNIHSHRCGTNRTESTLECGEEPGLSKFRFHSGKVHKLRLINPGAMGTMKFSIDGHRLLVTALDLVPINPYTTDHVVLSVGQRMEVLVRASRNPKDSYYMRAAQVGLPCGFSLNPFAKALILHEDAPDGTLPINSHPHKMLGNEDLTCISQPFVGTGPLDPWQIAKPDITKRFLVTSQINATGHQNYAVNGSIFHANYNHPLLLQVNRMDLNFEPSSNVHSFGHHKVGRVIVESETEGPHPMHLHGHDITVLAAGPGKWDGTTLNEGTPLRRDVHVLPPGGHLVLQFRSDNPGVWAFHCHIAWHLSMGFYTNFLTHPEEIGKRKEIARVMPQTCHAWEKWSSNHLVAEIDDGV